MGSGQLSQVMTTVSKCDPLFPPSVIFMIDAIMNHFRDPAQHAALKSDIESQSTAYYSTARLWDDGIIKPTDTRDVVGLGLALAACKGCGRREAGRGFGVFRM
jgi:3-methylcrotonyl-CoA carboxylase beta subunit